MRRVSFGLVLLALITAAPATASAQQEAGDRIFSVFGNIMSQDGSTTGLASFGLGKFLTRQLEIGTSATLVINSSDDGFGGTNVFTAMLVGALGRYNFATEGQKTFPFVGAEVGAFLDSDLPAMGYLRPHVGINSFLNRNVALNADAGLLNYFAESGTTTAVDIRFGVKVVF